MFEFRGLVDAVRRRVPGIRQPVLLVHPREDDRANIANSFWLQRNLAGPVSMVVLNDSYHVVTMDRQRQIVADRTVAFVESVARQRDGGAATTVEALRRVRQAPGCAA